ncbi:MAG: hypothetical protein N2645_06920 [Clostridia bacterium]|nr:hypothetical protein [Clostridia bacterium]
MRLPVPYYKRTKKSGVFRKPPLKQYNIELTQEELDNLIKIIEFGQLEIHRHFKKFSESDFDLKEIFYNYRYNSNQIRNKLKNIRGF